MRKIPIQAPCRLDPSFPIEGNKPVTLSNRNIDWMHIHDVLEIGLCLKGQGVFVVEDKVFQFSEGDIFIINHLEMHRACMPDGSKSTWYFFMLNPALLLKELAAAEPVIADTAMLSGTGFENKFPSRQFPKLHSLIVELSQEMAKNRRFSEAIIRLLVARIMIELIRLRPNQPDKKGIRTVSIMARLSPALTKIANRYADPLEVKTLAYACCMSCGHFRRLFKSVFQKSPLDYLNDYRIGMITALLISTNRSITDIALSCGFPTLSCFNRQFRERMGCSPRSWRNKKRR